MKPAATMVDDGWQQFEDPILLPDGRTLHTLREATDYITSLPKSESELAEWRIAIEALGLASRAGSTALARIAFLNALTRNTRKDQASRRPFLQSACLMAALAMSSTQYGRMAGQSRSPASSLWKPPPPLNGFEKVRRHGSIGA